MTSTKIKIIYFYAKNSYKNNFNANCNKMRNLKTSCILEGGTGQLLQVTIARRWASSELHQLPISRYFNSLLIKSPKPISEENTNQIIQNFIHTGFSDIFTLSYFILFMDFQFL